jgi:ABC-type transport system involved in multi-copper enzyme maturation permease subunit
MTAPLRQAVGGVAATLGIAGLTWRRLLRGRAIWITLILSAVPALVAVALIGRHNRHGVNDLLEISIWLLAVLAPLHVASSLSEELEDRTAAYLWSRPIPRWTIVSGKLLALVPLVWAFEVAGAAAAAERVGGFGVTFHVERVALGFGLGTLAAACCSVGISTLWPKHGMAISMVYLLFVDLPMGVIPAALQQLSITHYVRTLAGEPADATTLIGLGVVSLVWLLIALYRIRRLE